MRISCAGLALIRRDDSGGPLWLAQWNNKWQRYSFVGGHKNPAESYRECVIREIGEELGLIADRQFTVAQKPLTHLQYRAWSESAQEESDYTLELFEVAFVGDDSRRSVDADPQNRWLSADEIRVQCCLDGRAISETVGRLLNAIGALP